MGGGRKMKKVGLWLEFSLSFPACLLHGEGGGRVKFLHRRTCARPSAYVFFTRLPKLLRGVRVCMWM